MKCNLCGKEIVGFGNNPYPLCNDDDFESRCCDDCNNNYVIGARIIGLNRKLSLGDRHTIVENARKENGYYDNKK